MCDSTKLHVNISHDSLSNCDLIILICFRFQQAPWNFSFTYVFICNDSSNHPPKYQVMFNLSTTWSYTVMLFDKHFTSWTLLPNSTKFVLLGFSFNQFVLIQFSTFTRFDSSCLIVGISCSRWGINYFWREWPSAKPFTVMSESVTYLMVEEYTLNSTPIPTSTTFLFSNHCALSWKDVVITAVRFICVDTIAYQLNHPYPSMMFSCFSLYFKLLNQDTVIDGKINVPGFLFIKRLTPLNSNVS